jgi:hypothetical protein
VAVLDLDGDGALSDADLKGAARSNEALVAAAARGKGLAAGPAPDAAMRDIDARVARLHALVPSAEARRFSADELLHGAPLDQFIRILFALGEDEPEQEQEQEPEPEHGQGQEQEQEQEQGQGQGQEGQPGGVEVEATARAPPTSPPREVPALGQDQAAGL